MIESLKMLREFIMFSDLVMKRTKTRAKAREMVVGIEIAPVIMVHAQGPR
jgi:hypothetical protein